ncbi:MAG: serine protease [archaeon]
MPKDKCSHCGTTKTSTFWTFEDNTMLCDKCYKLHGGRWQKEIDKIHKSGKGKLLKKILIVLGIIFALNIFVLIVIGTLAYFGILNPSNETDVNNFETVSNIEPITSSEYCGNGYCGFAETCTSCPADCGRCLYCGDGYCNNGETCSTCSQDCGKCKNDVLDNIKNTIVWVKYEIVGRNADGTYFSNGGTGSGVITSNENEELTVYTNRHVVDCNYNELNCYQRISEKISVRTQDGNIYAVDKVSFSESDIDLAVLTIKTSRASDYESASYTPDFNINDEVTAVGYPSYAQNVVEFSVSEGAINNIKDVLSQSTGKSFKTIESDAYTYFGSSGGGLFDKNGNLVGINTWISNTNQNHMAIAFNSIANEQFIYCSEGSYYLNGKCYAYCDKTQILGNDGGCYDICNNFYCETRQTGSGDSRCSDAGYVVGTDGYCHEPCGSGYCADSTAICYRAKCVTCSVNMYLYHDGTCRNVN